MADIVKINLNGVDYNIVDSASTSAIAAEVARAQAAESANTQAIAAEVVARQSAITAVEQTLSGKADQATTYTKTEVDDKLSSAATATTQQIEQAVSGKQDTLTAGNGIDITNNVISVDIDTTLYVVVSELPAQPAAGNENKIHLVPLASGETQNMYAEYIWKGDAWEKLGEKQIDTDLSDYWTSAQTQSAITAATSGKVDTSALTDYWTSAQTEAEFQGVIGVSLLDYDTVQEVLSNAGVISVEGESGTEPGELTVNPMATKDYVDNALSGITASYSAATETLILNIPAAS